MAPSTHPHKHFLSLSLSHARSPCVCTERECMCNVHVEVDIIKTEASAQVRYAKGTQWEMLYDGNAQQHKNMPAHIIRWWYVCATRMYTDPCIHTHTMEYVWYTNNHRVLHGFYAAQQYSLTHSVQQHIQLERAAYSSHTHIWYGEWNGSINERIQLTV